MTLPRVSEKSIAQLVALDGRRAVVTGGAAGIGFAIVKRLSEAGADVLIADIDGAMAENSAAKIRHAGRKAISSRVDVVSAKEIGLLADRAVSELGGLDIWVNNAGIYPWAFALDISDEEWTKVLDVNLRGAFYGAREAARRMVAAKTPGVIVNITSTAGLDASSNPVHYVASKHGVVGMTKRMAVELGAQGIRVVAVAPTLTETEGVTARRKDEAADAGMKAYEKNLPSRRLGEPDDVARAVLFAVSDLGAFVTGSVIAADGGALAGQF